MDIVRLSIDRAKRLFRQHSATQSGLQSDRPNNETEWEREYLTSVMPVRRLEHPVAKAVAEITEPGDVLLSQRRPLHRSLPRVEVPNEVDLFSLDIDRNTYWIWAAVAEFKPRVVVVEYNASIPPSVDWKVDYHPNRRWNYTMYFGASLKALENLGRELGYSLVGCEISGINAFFVRSDLCCDRFEGPFDAEHHFEPPRYWLTQRVGHPRSFHDDEGRP